MKHMKTAFVAALMATFASAPAPVSAHPHVFIDTGLEIIFDDKGQLTHVKVTWQYDDLFSLLLAEDFKIDADGDGELTDAERTELTGFDADWVEGYAGDLQVILDGQILTLSRPIDPTADMTEGRIISSHLREVSGTPVLQGDPLSLKAFDPTYYTAYDMTLPVVIKGRTDCDIMRIEPDIQGQLAIMQAQLLALDANANLEENDIPEIGGDFATDIRVSCPVL